MTTSWASPVAAPAALVLAPWPPPDPATRVVDLRAACPWPAPAVTVQQLSWADSPVAASPVESPRRRRYPLAIALGTAMVAIAAFGALFLAI
ncbi:MAG: hypothetical protein AAGA42_05425 [Actinomycetota bacterium]